MAWDPKQYLRFAGERMQPAIDLLARIPAQMPRTVVDLGCGAGNMSPVLAARWPEAQLTGVDNSLEMLGRARVDHPAVTFVEADIARWRPAERVDVLFSNAALHWLDNQETLLPSLLGHVSPGGWFAVQMPRNVDAAMQSCTQETIANGPWRSILEPTQRPGAVAAPEVYWRMLKDQAASLTIWEIEYLHVLAGDNPVAEFAKGSGLKLLLDRLEEPMRSTFEAEYRRRIAAAYPKEADGHTLFKFRRLFILAQAKD
jgi:trans-aconitate 2-methyltransferase